MEPSSERPRTRLGGFPHSGRDRRRSTASPALKGQGAPRVLSVHRRLPGAQTSAWASRPTGAHVVNRPGLARGEENGCRALTGTTTRRYLLGALTGNGSLSICIRHGANASATYTRHSRKGRRPGPRLRRAHCPWSPRHAASASRAPWPRPAVLHTPFPGPDSLGRSEGPRSPCPRAGSPLSALTPLPFRPDPRAFGQPAIEMSGCRQGKAITAELVGGFPLNARVTSHTRREPGGAGTHVLSGSVQWKG